MTTNAIPQVPTVGQIAAELTRNLPRVYAVELSYDDVPPTIDLHPYGDASGDAVRVADFTRFGSARA